MLALFDQGARQGIGEDPRRQAEGDGRAHAFLADGVARFQMRVHHQPGIGMAGEIDIAGLRPRVLAGASGRSTTSGLPWPPCGRITTLADVTP